MDASENRNQFANVFIDIRAQNEAQQNRNEGNEGISNLRSCADSANSLAHKQSHTFCYKPNEKSSGHQISCGVHLA